MSKTNRMGTSYNELRNKQIDQIWDEEYLNPVKRAFQLEKKQYIDVYPDQPYLQVKPQLPPQVVYNFNTFADKFANQLISFKAIIDRGSELAQEDPPKFDINLQKWSDLFDSFIQFKQTVISYSKLESYRSRDLTTTVDKIVQLYLFFIESIQNFVHMNIPNVGNEHVDINPNIMKQIEDMGVFLQSTQQQFESFAIQTPTNPIPTNGNYMGGIRENQPTGYVAPGPYGGIDRRDGSGGGPGGGSDDDDDDGSSPIAGSVDSIYNEMMKNYQLPRPNESDLIDFAHFQFWISSNVIRLFGRGAVQPIRDIIETVSMSGDTDEKKKDRLYDLARRYISEQVYSMATMMAREQEVEHHSSRVGEPPQLRSSGSKLSPHQRVIEEKIRNKERELRQSYRIDPFEIPIHFVRLPEFPRQRGEFSFDKSIEFAMTHWLPLMRENGIHDANDIIANAIQYTITQAGYDHRALRTGDENRLYNIVQKKIDETVNNERQNEQRNKEEALKERRIMSELERYRDELEAIELARQQSVESASYDPSLMAMVPYGPSQAGPSEMDDRNTGPRQGLMIMPVPGLSLNGLYTSLSTQNALASHMIGLQGQEVQDDISNVLATSGNIQHEQQLQLRNSSETPILSVNTLTDKSTLSEIIKVGYQNGIPASEVGALYRRASLSYKSQTERNRYTIHQLRTLIDLKNRELEHPIISDVVRADMPNQTPLDERNRDVSLRDPFEGRSLSLEDLQSDDPMDQKLFAQDVTAFKSDAPTHIVSNFSSSNTPYMQNIEEAYRQRDFSRFDELLGQNIGNLRTRSKIILQLGNEYPDIDTEYHRYVKAKERVLSKTEETLDMGDEEDELKAFARSYGMSEKTIDKLVTMHDSDPVGYNAFLKSFFVNDRKVIQDANEIISRASRLRESTRTRLEHTEELETLSQACKVYHLDEKELLKIYDNGRGYNKLEKILKHSFTVAAVDNILTLVMNYNMSISPKKAGGAKISSDVPKTKHIEPVRTYLHEPTDSVEDVARNNKLVLKYYRQLITRNNVEGTRGKNNLLDARNKYVMSFPNPQEGMAEWNDIMDIISENDPYNQIITKFDLKFSKKKR